ncbi:MAG: hypothetical protein LCH73_14920 [Proteobacteria bacterium]|nr:hypothetical protein [Pseudomonadota bacterium]
MKVTLPSTSPRNPLVALVRARRAGRHGPSAKALRQHARQDLRRALRSGP